MKEEGVGREVPDRFAASKKPLKTGDFVGCDFPDLREPRWLIGAQLEGRSIRPGVSRDRIEPCDREVIAHVLAGGGEEILENQRQGQKARPGIEFEWSTIW